MHNAINQSDGIRLHGGVFLGIGSTQTHRHTSYQFQAILASFFSVSIFPFGAVSVICTTIPWIYTISSLDWSVGLGGACRLVVGLGGHGMEWNGMGLGLEGPTSDMIELTN